MEDIADRIDRHVDRSGEHHRWTGARRADGLGMVKVDGRVVTVVRAVWELAHGPLVPGARVRACPEDRACVRLDHLRVDRGGQAGRRVPARRAPNGAGSLQRTGPGVWKLTVTAGRFDDGTPRRAYRSVRADNETEARRLLAAFVTEVRTAEPTTTRALRDVTVDAAVALYLEHLGGEKGRADKTVADYRALHRTWFAEEIGGRRLRSVTSAALDAGFGRMQREGRSESTMRCAKALYGGLFRWARRRGIVERNPMADVDLPRSSYVPRGRPAAEAEELALLLGAAAEHTPEVLALLVLGATSGLRRSELVALRRSSVDWARGRLRVEVAADGRGGVKATKTGRQRTLRIDDETTAVLRRHCEEMDEQAAWFGPAPGPDAFVFSLEPDCSKPMPPDYVTGRVAVLKEHLGVADKRPGTAALEDEALRLFRSEPSARPAGRTGPPPRGGMTFADIGARLGRSERWAAKAVAAAQRREAAAARGLGLGFDASVQGLRRFTSTELLDAGFNVGMVASRQGHSPQVLLDHYSKRRRSEDARAAEHLGRIVHGGPEREAM